MMHELSDLVGGADIADLLGVGPSAVANWSARDDTFPAPIVRISRNNIPVWSLEQVLEWVAATGRTKLLI